MKKMILMATLGVILTATSIQAENGIPAIVTTDLNVRQLPTTNSKIIDVLPEGTEIEVFDSGNANWNKINSEDYTGYVYNEYLTLKENSTEIERLYEPSDFRYLGVLEYDKWRWTWYSEKVLPGSGLNIPGRHTNEDGYVCDQDEYICLASVDLNQGTVIKTPLGYYGKVYDTGCPSGTLDVYTNW